MNTEGCKKFFPWLMQMLMFSTVGMIFILIIVLTFVNDYFTDYGYIGTMMDINWKQKYISDIKFSATECSKDWETLTLGEWSGFFGGVYLYSNTTNAFVLEGPPTCNAFNKDAFNGFTCKNIEKTTKEFKINKFRNNFICVKRSTENFYDIFNKLNKEFNEKNLYSKKEASAPGKPALKSRALVSLMFVNKNDYPNEFTKLISPASGFENQPLINNQYHAFYKFIDPTTANNIFLDNIITDIRLNNYYFCAYSDLYDPSVTPEMVSKGRVSYGYEFCDVLPQWKSKPFSDNYVRTRNLHELDASTTKINFYTDEIINELRKINSDAIKVLKNNFHDTGLVADYYPSALGCGPLPRKIEDMGKIFYQYHELRNCCITAMFFSTLYILVSFAYHFFYCKQNKKLMLILTIVLLFFAVFIFITILGFYILAASTHGSVKKYLFECRNNLQNFSLSSQSETPMEVQYLQGTYYLAEAGGYVMLVCVGNLIFSIMYLFSCKCWNTNEEEEAKEGENKDGVEEKGNEVEFKKVPSINY